MKKAKISVIRYAAEDVIAASGVLCSAPVGNGWTAEAYKATASFIIEEDHAHSNYYAYGPAVSDVYNFLNGEPSMDTNGDIFSMDHYYHYRTNSLMGKDYGIVPVYSMWWECSDPSHWHPQ